MHEVSSYLSSCPGIVDAADITFAAFNDIP